MVKWVIIYIALHRIGTGLNYSYNQAKGIMINRVSFNVHDAIIDPFPNLNGTAWTYGNWLIFPYPNVLGIRSSAHAGSKGSRVSYNIPVLTLSGGSSSIVWFGPIKSFHASLLMYLRKQILPYISLNAIHKTRYSTSIKCTLYFPRFRVRGLCISYCTSLLRDP